MKMTKSKELEEDIKIPKEDTINKDMIENPLKDYFKYIEYLEDHNWVRERVTIYENLSALVTITNLKANNEGTVIDLVCPPGRMISFLGIKNFSEDFDIKRIPCFEIKLADSNGKEINPDTHIKILKKKILRIDIELCNVQYKDVSMSDYSDSPNKFKNHTDIFRFKDRIDLKGEEHLKIHVINPDIDINNVKFNLGIDLWTQTL